MRPRLRYGVKIAQRPAPAPLSHKQAHTTPQYLRLATSLFRLAWMSVCAVIVKNTGHASHSESKVLKHKMPIATITAVLGRTSS